MDQNKGSIKQGKNADFTIFDKDFKIMQTIVEGETVYSDLNS